MKIRNKTTGEVIEVPDGTSRIENPKTGEVIDIKALVAASSPSPSSIAPPPETVSEPQESTSLNPFGTEPVGEAFRSGYESSLGAGPALVEGFNKISGYIPGLNLKLPESVGTDILDPALAANAGLMRGVMALGQKFGPTGPQVTGALSRGFRAAGERAGMEVRGHEPTEQDVEGMKEFVRTGAPSGDLQPYEPFSTLSTPVNVIMGLGTDALNDPVAAIAMSGAMGKPGAKSTTPARSRVGKPSNEAVDLLQEQLKPGPQTRVGQEFETLGERGLENIAREERKAPTKGKGADRLLENAGRSKRTTGDKFEDMHREAEQKGLTLDRSAIRQEEARLKAQPYYEFIEPEIAAKFDNLMKGEGPVSMRQAHEILTKILEKKRAIDNRVGIGEDVANATQKVEALTALETVIKKQLNEKLSRTPNEYLEASADYQSVAQLEDLIKTAKTAARNSGDASFVKAVTDAVHDIGWKIGAGGAVGFSLGGFTPLGAAVGGGAVVAVNLLQNLLKKSARQRLMGKALNIAVKNPVKIKPVGPQKPSTLPQPPSAPAPKISLGIPNVQVPAPLLAKFQYKQSMMNPMGHGAQPPNAINPFFPRRPIAPESTSTPGGITPNAAPIQATPRPEWFSNVQSAAGRSPIEQFRDIQHAQKVIEGKAKMTYAEALKDPNIHKWEKNILQRLAEVASREGTESALRMASELEAEIKQRVHPF